MVDLARPSLTSAMPMRAPMAYHSCEITDPDTEFAYLGKKLSALLGDAQKAFEGEGFADKLGSMGGKYGSFLPMRSRDCPMPHQEFRYSNTDPSMLARRDSFLQKAKMKSAVLDVNREDYFDVIDDDIDDNGGDVGNDGHHHHSGQDQGQSHGHGGVDANLKERNDNNANSTIASSFAVDDVVKHAGFPQKKVVLRIKIGSESDIKKKNATVYSDFGLCNSSSSCDDDTDNEDEEEDDGMSDFAMDSSPEKSPMSIIRVMTLSHIPDGRLLSPSLPDLVEENYLQNESSFLDKVGYHNKVNGKTFEGNNLHKERLLSDNGDSQNLIQPGIEEDEPVSVKEWRKKVDDSAEKGNGNRKCDNQRSFGHVSKKVKLKRDKGRSSVDSVHSLKDVVKETSSSLETGMIRKRPSELDSELVRQGKRRSSLKGSNGLNDVVTNTGPCERRKSLKTSKPRKCGETFADVSVSSKEAFKDVTENQDHWKDPLEEAYPSRGSTTYRGKEHPKEEWKNSTKPKELTFWDVSKDPLNLKLRKEAPECSSKLVDKGIQQKYTSKSQRIEISELMKEEKIPKDKIKTRLPIKNVSKLYEQSFKESVSQDMLRSDQITFQNPACTQINSSIGHLDSVGVDPLPVPGVLIMENWVLCDKCEQWRLLPPGVENENLPKQWVCKMIDWLQPGLNNCSILEETTTEATRLLYHNHQASLPVEHSTMIPPFPPPQVNLMGPAVPSTVRNAGQVTKLIDKNRLSVVKKRKVRVTCNENILGKCDNDMQKVCYDVNHMNRAIQQVHQVRSSVDPEHAQVVVEEEEIKEIDRRKETAKHRENKEKEREIKEKKETEKEQKKKEREKKEKEREKKEREKKEREEKEREEKEREEQQEEIRRPKVPCPSDSIIPLIAKERGQSAAALVIQEAINLKQRAEYLNSRTGVGSEGTSLYLQAALKFLQAGSMLEARGGEIRNESLSINIYSDTARLCEFCAINYESRKDFAASALAYKCAALAHMRVVQGKSSSIVGDRAEMMSFSGEFLNSPLPKDSKWTSSSSLNSQMGDALIVPEKSRLTLFRVLQYVESTTAAMEALTKSSYAFNACKDSINSSAGLDAVKKVLDMGFHDVESLIWFARVALEATGH